MPWFDKTDERGIRSPFTQIAIHASTSLGDWRKDSYVGACLSMRFLREM